MDSEIFAEFLIDMLGGLADFVLLGFAFTLQ
jgi:hypothetical protein